MGFFSAIFEGASIITTSSTKELFNKAINIGIIESTEHEVANRIKLVNKLCLLIGLLMLIIIPIVLIKVIYSPFILACFILEYLINASVILSNYLGKHRTASLTFYFNQCFFVAFFGTLFGGVQLQFAIIFLICVIYLIEKDDFLRTVCFAVAVIDLIILQGIYWYEVEPVQLSKEGKFIIQSLVIGGVMVILFFLSIPYKKSNDNIYDLLSANRHTKTFLAHTVHEVRSPLNVLHLLSTRLENSLKNMGADTDPVKDILRIMKMAATHGVHYTESSLSLAEIEAGASPPNQYQSLKIKSFIAEIIEFHTHLVDSKKIRFELSASTFPAIIITDPNKLKQILSNLITNVIKYGSKNSTCTIALEADHIGSKWNLAVTNLTDSDKELDIAKMFMPFSRALNGIYVPQSSGLGLFICKTRAEELGGEIAAFKNLKTRAVTITVNLPLSIGDITSLPKVKIIEQEQITIKEMLTGKKVLIADDDDLSARALIMDLESFGAISLVATDGEMLIKMAHEQAPDIILMDYHMPKLNGEAALEKLKSSPNTQHIPIIVTSGDVNYSAALNRMMIKGADDSIRKPINLKKLTSAMVHLTVMNEINKKSV